MLQHLEAGGGWLKDMGLVPTSGSTNEQVIDNLAKETLKVVIENWNKLNDTTVYYQNGKLFQQNPLNPEVDLIECVIIGTPSELNELTKRGTADGRLHTKAEGKLRLIRNQGEDSDRLMGRLQGLCQKIQIVYAHLPTDGSQDSVGKEIPTTANKQSILRAVVPDGLQLAYASFKIPNDKEVVTAAVEQTKGKAFEYATKDIILWAVNYRASNIQFASPELQLDQEILRAALKKDPKVFKQVTKG